MDPATQAAAVREAERVRQEADQALQALKALHKPKDPWKELEYKLFHAAEVLNLWWVNANGNIVINPKAFEQQNE